METALVLRHQGLGDLVTAQPALRAIKRKLPGVKLITTCPSWLKDLAHHFGSADGIVTEQDAARAITDVDPSRHQDIDATMLSAIAERYTRPRFVICLRTPDQDLAHLLRILQPKDILCYKFDDISQTSGNPELDFSDHILTRWKKLLAIRGYVPTEADLYTSIPVDDSRAGYTIIHPGAGGAARLWPAARWAEVARRAAETGHRILISGSVEEKARCVEVAALAGLPLTCVIAGRTSIMDMTRYVAGARVVISVDTGIAHLATALKAPAITIFGPVSPSCWGPPPGNPQHTTIWKGRDGDPYGPELDPGLDEITAGEVCDLVAAY